MIDPSGVTYHLYALLPSGEFLPLRRALTGLSWEEQPAQLAVRLQAQVFNAPTSGGWLHQALALGGKVLLFAEWGQGEREVFRGTVVEWDFADAGAETLSLVCYDDLLYLAQSEDEYLFEAGQSGASVLTRIFQDWLPPGVLGAVEGPQAAMPKLALGGSLADSIYTVLAEAFYAGDGEYLVRAEEGTVSVVRPGQNQPIYHLRATHNLAAFVDHQSIADLVTEVRVVGEQSDETPVPADDTAPIRPALDRIIEVPDPAVRAFGRFRALVTGQENDSWGDLEEKAAAILAERGAPRRIRQFSAPDLPFLRRGDVVRVTAGTMVGELCVVTGISHDGDARRMQLVVDSSGTVVHRQRKGTPAAAAQEQPVPA